jgi:hypothetical protein
LTGKTQRLKRLARAQGELVKVLEAGLLRAEQQAAAHSAAQSQLDAMAVKAGQTQPALLPALLRSLSATEAQVKQSRLDVEKVQQRLLAAKGREKAISSRAKSLGDGELRKAGEEEALETTLAMNAKASGKGRVVI